MHVAFSARSPHCCQALRRRTNSLLSDRFRAGPHTLKHSVRLHSVDASSKNNQKSSGSGTRGSTPKAQPPTPGSPRSNISSAIKSTAYIPSFVPTIRESRFDFEEDRQRKLATSATTRKGANTIGREHAMGLAEILNKGHSKNPVALFGILAGWLLRHHARNLGYGVAPDGFVRVSDVLRFPPFQDYTVDRLARLIKADSKDRFEMTRLPDYVEGIIEDVWWVRARANHSIPGVSAHCKRILRLDRMRIVEYRTRPENWQYILTHGIPEGPQHLICLYHPTGKDLFEEHIPRKERYLCITIDSEKASQMGVTFYHTNDVQLLAVGTPNKHVIPFEACRSAVIVDVTKETLK